MPRSYRKLISLLDQQKAAIPLALQPRQSFMPGIRFHGLELSAALVVKLMHQLRIMRKTRRGSDFFDAVPLPQPACIAKCRHTGFRRHARAG